MSGQDAAGGQPAAHRPDRYRLYIDESGDHTYKKLNEVSHRYLALLGLWCRQKDEYVALHDGLEKLRRDVFGPRPDDPVILHREDIINKRGDFYVLQAPDKERALNDGLLQLVQSASFRMVCIVIDKQQHQDKYASPMHPYHYCLAAVLQRYCGWLNYKNVVGDVLAEARGRVEDQQLESAYSNIHASGTLYLEASTAQRVLTSKSLNLRRKDSDIAGLQLADVLAHPVKQWVLWQKGIIAEPKGFGRHLADAARAKFNRRNDTGQVEGYGWKIL
jgi:hypothetical protein